MTARYSDRRNECVLDARCDATTGMQTGTRRRDKQPAHTDRPKPIDIYASKLCSRACTTVIGHGRVWIIAQQKYAARRAIRSEPPSNNNADRTTRRATATVEARR